MRMFYLLFSVLLTVFLITSTTASHAAHHRDGATATQDHAGATGDGAHANPAAQHTPGAHWSAPAAEKARVNPLPLSADRLIEAGDLFRDNCAACHGAEGRGNGPAANDLERAPTNLLAMAPQHSDGDLRWKIAKGRGEMPGWEDVLSEAEIWMLVHYMKTLPAYHHTAESGGHSHANDDPNHSHQ